MMRRTWLQRLPLGAAAFAPWLAPAGAHAQGAPQVWLRVRNHSQEAFTHVWQGLPQQGTDVDLGPLLPGDTSRWHALPATLAHYRKTRLQIGQRQFTHVADTSFPGGRATLAPGHYTVHLAWVRQPALAALPQTLRWNMAGIEVDGSARLVTLRR